MYRLPWTGVGLLALLPFFGRSLALSPACVWFPTSDFRDISLACYGPSVTAPPYLTPQTLQSLYLIGTGLRVLSGEVFSGRRLPRLRYLSITDGVLSSIGSNALCSLSDLAVLDLSSNRLHQVDTSSFECNRKLLRVDLSGNTDLDRLPPLLSDSIETLDAERCNITDVGVSDLDGMPALKILHLNGNADLDCEAVKSRLSAARPSLQVVCDGSFGSDSLMVSGVNSISNTQQQSSISVTLPRKVTPTETYTGPQVDTQSSVTQRYNEEQTYSTVKKRVLHSTTEIPSQQTAGSTKQAPYAINKVTDVNTTTVTYRNELYVIDITFIASMGVLLSSMILFSLLVYYFKKKLAVNQFGSTNYSSVPCGEDIRLRP